MFDVVIEVMIRLRHQQPSLWDTFFAEEVVELWEPWMQVVGELLRDEELLDIVYAAQGKRHVQSRTHGRPQMPAEVVLRMLILKHVRNWSYEVLEREVRANAVYRTYPTDSGLLQDGARVMTRSMQKIEKKVGGLKRKIRNRMRSVTKRVIAIGHALRHKGLEGEEKRKREYRELLSLTRRILNDARRVLQEVETLPRRRRQKVRGISQQLQNHNRASAQCDPPNQSASVSRSDAVPGKRLSASLNHTLK